MKSPVLATVAVAGVAGVSVLLLWSLEGKRSSSKRMTKKNDPSTPDLLFDETPDPPLLGASQTCTDSLYQIGGKVSNSVKAIMNSAARSVVTPPSGSPWFGEVQHYDEKGFYKFHQAFSDLTTQGQIKVFKMAVAMLKSPDRTTLSITTRNILKAILPECNWDADLWPVFGRPSLSKKEYNIWTSAWYLVKAAAAQDGIQIGGKQPTKNLMIPTGNDRGLIIGRGFLGLSDVASPGTLSLVPGQRVELIGGDYRKSELPRPPFFHAEPLYARVINSDGGRPMVEIIGTFKERDVSPKFAHRHGFDVGRRLRLPGSGTTAIRKIYPVGME